MKHIDQLMEGLLGGFLPKQRKVIEERFGLKTGKRSTLQKIGDALGVTRERVRQIEAQSLKKLPVQVQRDAGDLLDLAHRYLEDMGGVRRDDHFIEDVKRRWMEGVNAKHLNHKLRFLFLVAERPRFHKEDETVASFWYTDDKAKNKFFRFVEEATGFFKRHGRDAILNDKKHLAVCKDFAACHFFVIPKHFGTNIFGDIGLREWPEIEPRTVRDKAYLVLKKGGAPLHFGEIARLIHERGIDRKPAHIQTVHNELIKDDRFVLVGRGIYALQEQGFQKGTVREVIARLLKARGPLASQQVISLVKQQRLLKENTILLNLQNRKYFKRFDDGTYHVREA